jgi:hypothetical protein
MHTTFGSILIENRNAQAFKEIATELFLPIMRAKEHFCTQKNIFTDFVS